MCCNSIMNTAIYPTVSDRNEQKNRSTNTTTFLKYIHVYTHTVRVTTPQQVLYMMKCNAILSHNAAAILISFSADAIISIITAVFIIVSPPVVDRFLQILGKADRMLTGTIRFRIHFCMPCSTPVGLDEGCRLRAVELLNKSGKHARQVTKLRRALAAAVNTQHVGVRLAARLYDAGRRLSALRHCRRRLSGCCCSDVAATGGGNCVPLGRPQR